MPAPTPRWEDRQQGRVRAGQACQRKGMLVKQSSVEELAREKTCSIPIPTIIVKGALHQQQRQEQPGQQREPTRGPQSSPASCGGRQPGRSPFAAAIAGAVRDREGGWRPGRGSGLPVHTDPGDEDVGLGPPAPGRAPPSSPRRAEPAREGRHGPLSSPAPREPENHFVGVGRGRSSG